MSAADPRDPAVAELETPLPCARCGEEPVVCCLKAGKRYGLPADEYFVRVRRISKCRGYRPPGRGGKVCSVGPYPSLLEAVAVWDRDHGTLPALEARRDPD